MATDLRDDTRVYFAAERSFLAWIRTGLALMGFGFVVARFGLFMRVMHEITVREGSPQFTLTGFSFAVGVLLVVFGVFVNIAATVHHVRLTLQLATGNYRAGRPAFFAIAVAIFLALVGLAMAIYLVLSH